VATATVLQWIVVWTSFSAPVIVNLMVHSTIIIVICLGVMFAFYKKGAAVQSVILRSCMVAVLICPAVPYTVRTLGIHRLWMPGISPEDIVVFHVPAAGGHTHTGETPAVVSAAGFVREGQPTAEVYVQPPDGKAVTDVLNAGAASPSVGTFHDARQDRIDISPIGENAATAPAPGGEKQTERTHHKAIVVLYLLFPVVWFGCSLFFMARMVFGIVCIRFIFRTANPAHPSIVRMCRKLARTMNVPPPRVIKSEKASKTFLCGIVAPTIIIPAHGYGESMTSRQVIIHELAHLSRRDHVWNGVGLAVRIVFPLQPLAWFLVRKFRELSDYICDDYVVSYTGTRYEYALNLLAIIQSLRPDISAFAAGSGIITGKSQIRKRIERILDRSQKLYLRPRPLEAAFITALSLSSLALTGFVSFGPECEPGAGFTAVDTTQAAVRQHAPLHTITGPKTDKTICHDVLNDTYRLDTPSAERVSVAPERIQMAALSPDRHDDGRAIDLPTLSRIEPRPGAGVHIQPIESHVPEAEQPGEFSIAGGDKIAYDPTDESLRQAASTETVKPAAVFVDDTFRFPGVFARRAGGDDAPGEGNAPIPANLKKIVQTEYDSDGLENDGEGAIDTIAKYTWVAINQFDPVWSPDGEWIAFTDRHFSIWLVSPEGGMPVPVYSSYLSQEWRGFRLQAGDIRLYGFSPDGNRLLFQDYVIDEERGTQITITSDEQSPGGGSWGFHITGMVPVLRELNLRTGSNSILVDEAYQGRFSPDGRYVAYLRYDHRTITDPESAEHVGDLAVIDTATGETRYLTDGDYEAGSFCFTPDNSAVIAAMKESNGGISQLYRIPLGTGNENMEPLTSFSAETAPVVEECSPDGKCVIYAVYSELPKKLVSYNMSTGRESVKTIPDLAQDVCLSPEQTRFCYVFRISESIEMYHLYTELYDPELTEVEEESPAVFALNGNFPNPFNMSTTIQFTLPGAGEVRLDIFNVTGQKVRTLVRQTMDAGVHRMVWDGRTDNGQTVSSGVYLSQLSLDGKTAVGKMMLEK